MYIMYIVEIATVFDCYCLIVMQIFNIFTLRDC